MKLKESGQRSIGHRRAPARIAPLPMEWMDPMSWRLPSGKALAEFALQSGFLAPLMLSGPPSTRKGDSAPVVGPNLRKAGEGPDSSGTFREDR